MGREGEGKQFFNLHMEFLHFRDNSMTVPQKVDAAFLPFQTVFFITAFCSTCIITDGLSGIIFFKGSLLYTSYSVLQRRKVKL
uniref:Uncharacterized protein n=1 Tax=Moschus moschiferus TaxID=68415 RepID=A0A8C6FKY2_MOSMO